MREQELEFQKKKNSQIFKITQEKCSPLILSEFAGTYGSLGGAIRVNPWDYKEVAESIKDALEMSEDDKTSRHMVFQILFFNSFL